MCDGVATRHLERVECVMVWQQDTWRGWSVCDGVATRHLERVECVMLLKEESDTAEESMHFNWMWGRTVLPSYKLFSIVLSVWKEGCSRDARRDPHLLGRTSAAVIHCLSQQMSLMDPSRAETLVGVGGRVIRRGLSLDI